MQKQIQIQPDIPECPKCENKFIEFNSSKTRFYLSVLAWNGSRNATGSIESDGTSWRRAEDNDYENDLTDDFTLECSECGREILGGQDTIEQFIKQGEFARDFYAQHGLTSISPLQQSIRSNRDSLHVNAQGNIAYSNGTIIGSTGDHFEGTATISTATDQTNNPSGRLFR